MCSIHVTDPASAFTFYRETLGFAELMKVPEAGLFIVRSPFDLAGVGLLLEPSDNPVATAYMKGVHDLGLPIIVFGVPDVRAEHRRLTELGVQFVGEPEQDPMGTWTAVFDDKHGNYIQLHEDAETVTTA